MTPDPVDLTSLIACHEQIRSGRGLEAILVFGLIDTGARPTDVARALGTSRSHVARLKAEGRRTIVERLLEAEADWETAPTTLVHGDHLRPWSDAEVWVAWGQWHVFHPERPLW